jgi:hypothetical protein
MPSESDHLEHVRHLSFWKDDHVATLERNGVRLEVKIWAGWELRILDT